MRSVANDRHLWSDHHHLKRIFARHDSDHGRRSCIRRDLGRSSSSRRGSTFLNRVPSCATTRFCHLTAHWEDASRTLKDCIVQLFSAMSAPCRHVGRQGRGPPSRRDPYSRSATSVRSRAKRLSSRSAMGALKRQRSWCGCRRSCTVRFILQKTATQRRSAML